MPSAREEDEVNPKPSLAAVTRVFLRVGLLSFGGPAGQIALLHRELVEERKWLSESQFLHALSFCMLLPGPEAQQLATYSGWLLRGIPGGLVAGGLFVLPGLAIIIALASVYALFGHTPLLGGLFYGLRAAVLIVVIDALIRVGRRALRTPWHVTLAMASFLALFVFQTPFPVVIIVTGLIGLALKEPKGAAPDASARAPAEPICALCQLGVALAGVLIWALPFGLIGLFAGPDSLFMALATFFSKMALVTFGGAYAVLAYVAQSAVQQFHWLSPTQMIDGLALAETTPGPLLLVLSYVGFLASFQQPGTLAPLLSGVTGAVLTAWVTFVPCFIWIFLGAPFVEGLRDWPLARRALSGITAAVVGVMANLSLWFALQVLFAQTRTLSAGPVTMLVPVPLSLDPFALLLALVAALVLFGLRAGLVVTLGLCAVGGLVLRPLGWSF